jgi:hypothetical protein
MKTPLYGIDGVSYQSDSIQRKLTVSRFQSYFKDSTAVTKDSTVVAKDISARTWLLCRLRAMRYEWNFSLAILK